LISSKVKVLDGQGTLIEASGFCMPNGKKEIMVGPFMNKETTNISPHP
jgi:hypothetical protein